MTQVIAYVRVSTDEQASQGVSLEAQREKCRQWCNLNLVGYGIRVFADEGISGKKMQNRPGFCAAVDEAMRYAGVGGEVIFLVYSLSRFSRSTKDTIEKIEQLSNAGIDFVSIVERVDTTTPTGRFFTTVIAALAQLEREQIVERTKAALEHKRSRGENTGTPPYGFKAVDGKLELAEDEQPGLEVILEAAGAEQVSYSGIARRLNEAGIRTRSGGSWDRGVVRRIVLYCQSQRGQDLIRRMNDDC